MKLRLMILTGLVLASTGQADAAVILGASSISSPQGDLGGSFALNNIINQAGLSGGYTSGVTDFNSFTSTVTHAGLTGTGFTNTEDVGPQQFTFDLGAVFTIDRIAIWNTSSVGRISSFRVLSDNDSNFGNGTTGVMLGASALAGAGPAQVFAFASTTTRFLHVEGLTTLAPPDYYGLGEVAFGMSAPVPEPASFVVWGLGAVGMLYARRKRRLTGAV